LRHSVRVVDAVALADDEIVELLDRTTVLDDVGVGDELDPDDPEQYPNPL
jgi:hypothetical protein